MHPQDPRRHPAHPEHLSATQQPPTAPRHGDGAPDLANRSQPDPTGQGSGGSERFDSDANRPISNDRRHMRDGEWNAPHEPAEPLDD